MTTLFYFFFAFSKFLNNSVIKKNSTIYSGNWTGWWHKDIGVVPGLVKHKTLYCNAGQIQLVYAGSGKRYKL